MSEIKDIENEVNKDGKAVTKKLSFSDVLALDNDGYDVRPVGDCDDVNDEISLKEKKYLSGDDVVNEINRALAYAVNGEYDSKEMRAGAMAVVELIQNVIRYL